MSLMNELINIEIVFAAIPEVIDYSGFPPLLVSFGINLLMQVKIKFAIIFIKQMMLLLLMFLIRIHK